MDGVAMKADGLYEHAQEMYAWRATYALLERIALAAKAVKK